MNTPDQALPQGAVVCQCALPRATGHTCITMRRTSTLAAALGLALVASPYSIGTLTLPTRAPATCGAMMGVPPSINA